MCVHAGAGGVPACVHVHVRAHQGAQGNVCVQLGRRLKTDDVA